MSAPSTGDAPRQSTCSEPVGARRASVSHRDQRDAELLLELLDAGELTVVDWCGSRRIAPAGHRSFRCPAGTPRRKDTVRSRLILTTLAAAAPPGARTRPEGERCKAVLETML